MTLNVDDLATATSYHRSVYAQLVQVLEEIKAYCELPSTADNKWSQFGKPSLYLALASPRFGNQQNIRAEFGFDFERDDAGWDVAQLRLPSAYFTVRCNDPLDLRYPESWESAPEDWGEEYRQVKHLDALQVNGDPLHMKYIEFFQVARDELWLALGN